MNFFLSAWVIACKEFKESSQSFWVLIGALLFALISFVIVFGTAALGGTFAFRSLEDVFRSLVMLSVFLIPLLSILVSYDAFAGEEENGTLILLLTYPIRRSALLTGKLLGQAASLGFSLVIGLSVTPVLSVLGILPYNLSECLFLIGILIFSGIALGIVFILLSYFVSLLTVQKARALGILLFIWLVSVLLYDLGLLIITIAFEGRLNPEILNFCVAVNPASAFRLLNLNFGEDSVFSVSSLKLVGYIAAWILLLFVSDKLLLEKKTF